LGWWLRHRPANQVQTRLQFGSRLDHLPRDSHRFWRCVRLKPRVSPLHSQVALFLQSSGIVFNIAGPGSFSRSLPSQRELPDPCAPFVRLSTFLFLAGSTFYF